LQRVREAINISIKYSGILALLIFTLIMLFAESFVGVFISDKAIEANNIRDNIALLERTPNALRWVFAATPVIVVQLIGCSYFQAIGKVTPALLLSLTKQGFFLIPLILILPTYFGVWGVWVSFPIADVCSTLVTDYFLRRAIKHDLSQT